jgi:hypothetical protein
MPALPRVVDGKLICRTIQKARQRPKSYPTLVRRVQPKILDWIRGATDWDDADAGQSRMLSFETPLPNGAMFFIRFWSEPRTPLLCEIPSGIQNDALRPWLTASAHWWSRHNGLTVSGVAQNFHGEFAVDSDFLKEVVAAFVVETLTECIAFKGHTPLVATLAQADCPAADLRPDARAVRDIVH